MNVSQAIFDFDNLITKSKLPFPDFLLLRELNFIGNRMFNRELEKAR